MHSKVHGRLRAILLSIVMLVSLGAVVLGPVSVANADPGCVNGGVYVVFARGSGEHLNDLRANQFYKSVKTELDNRKLPMGWSEIGNEDGDVPVNMNDDPTGYGNHPPQPDDWDEYPAYPVDKWNVINLANGNYGYSVNKGTNELIAHLNDRAAKCPGESIVVGGYSQGADVVGWALQRTGYGSLNQTTRDHIGYVALYGDPKFDAGNLSQRQQWQRPWWVRGDDPGFRYTSDATVLNSGALGARQAYVPEEFNGRFGSWCAYRDGVCTGSVSDNLDIGTHSKAYDDTPNWIKLSAPEIANQAIGKRNQLNPSSPPASRPSYSIAQPDPSVNVPIRIDPPPLPVPWSFENLEGDPGAISPYNADVGHTAASATFNGQLYVFHHDAVNGRLRYAKAQPNWVFGTLDGRDGPAGSTSNNVGTSPTAVVYNNELHVFYYDSSAGNLRHAWTSNGTYWKFENLDGDPGSVGGLNSDLGQTPAATAYGSSLQLFYYDAGNTNLRHAWFNGTRWSFETLEGDPGSVSHYDSNVGVEPSTIVSSGQLHVFYYDVSRGNLRHARASNTEGWRFENLDGDPGSIAGTDADLGRNSVAIEHAGVLHVFYHNQTKGLLRHMWTSSTAGWRAENLTGDAASALPYVSSIGSSTAAVSIDNVLHLFAYEATGKNLVHVWDDGSGWKIENLDGKGGEPAGRQMADVGMDPTAVAYGGKPHVFYYSESGGDLRHSWAR